MPPFSFAIFVPQISAPMLDDTKTCGICFATTTQVLKIQGLNFYLFICFLETYTMSHNPKFSCII